MEPRPSTGSGQAFRGGDAAFAGLTQLEICGPSTRWSFPRGRESRPGADRFCESVLRILKIIPAALRATTDLPGAGCWLRYSGAVRASQEFQTLTRRPALSTIHCVILRLIRGVALILGTSTQDSRLWPRLFVNHKFFQRVESIVGWIHACAGMTIESKRPGLQTCQPRERRATPAKALP